jgi:subtilisin family serine protease
MRQAGDQPFKDLLDRVRFGGCSKEDLEVLKQLKKTTFPEGIVPTKLYSKNINVDIINMSLGAPSQPPTFIHDLIKEAVSKGIVVIAAAGNDSHAVNYPARYDEVIAVAALDESGNLATFTSKDFTVDIVAPGTNIYSTHLNGNYCKMSGTSQASPFVAGICALIKAALKNQNLLPEFGNQFCQEDMMVALRNISSLQNYQVQPGEEQNWGPGVPKLANIDWSNITVKKS